MGYAQTMSTRPAPEAELDPEIFGVSITDADWAAMSDAERAFIQVGIDELDRGEFVTHEEMKREFKRMREKYAIR